MPIMTPNPALGVNSRLGIGAAFPVTMSLDFLSETLGLRESFIDPQGMRGTRSHAANRVRASGRLVTGAVNLAPTALEWTYILPYATGGTPVVSGTGNNYPLAETLPAFVAQIQRGATLFDYTGLRVNTMDVTGTPGQIVGCNLNVLGVDETRPGGSYPGPALDTGTNYFIFPDSYQALTVNGDTIDCFSFNLRLDNAVQVRNVNSQTATVVYSIDRVVTWTLEVPWGDDEALYGLAQGGVAVSIVFTYGNLSLSFSSPKVLFPRESPDIPNRDEIHNRLVGTARYSVAPGDELTAFCDSTP